MSLRCVFLSTRMLALWRGSGDLEVVHDREDQYSVDPLTLSGLKSNAFTVLKTFARQETIKCAGFKDP